MGQHMKGSVMGFKRGVIGAVCVVWGVAPALAEDRFIAGVDAAQRPPHAPVITEFAKDEAWQKRALTGVEEPYPESLNFLKDQGGWFNPFLHPGMLAPYDMRHWHENS